MKPLYDYYRKGLDLPLNTFQEMAFRKFVKNIYKDLGDKETQRQALINAQQHLESNKPYIWPEDTKEKLKEILGRLA